MLEKGSRFVEFVKEEYHADSRSLGLAIKGFELA